MLPAPRVRWLLILFERVEEAVQFQAVEDHTGALRHGGQTRPPLGVKRLALDAYVHHRLGIVQAAFQHGMVLSRYVALDADIRRLDGRAGRNCRHAHKIAAISTLGCAEKAAVPAARRLSLAWQSVTRSTLAGRRLVSISSFDYSAASAVNAKPTFVGILCRPRTNCRAHRLDGSRPVRSLAIVWQVRSGCPIASVVAWALTLGRRRRHHWLRGKNAASARVAFWRVPAGGGMNLAGKLATARAQHRSASQYARVRTLPKRFFALSLLARGSDTLATDYQMGAFQR